MSESNPFESARAGSHAAPSESALYTATVYLTQTRPWLLFLGVMGLLGSALMMFLGVALALMGMGDSSELGALGMMGPAIGLVYGVIGLFYAVPAVMMIQQAMAIGQVINGGGFDAVNDVLRHSRNFWRLVGGFTLFVMVLYCGGFGLAMIVGLGAAGSQF